MEGLQLVVVAKHLRAVVCKQASAAVLEQLLYVQVCRFHADALETVSAGIAADAVHRRHPEPSLLVAEHVLDLVVWQSGCVVSAEILVILMPVVAVQSAERAYPQLPGLVLRDALHTAVRQLLRHYKAVLLVFVALLLRLRLLAGEQNQCQQSQRYLYRLIHTLFTLLCAKIRKIIENRIIENKKS